MRNRLKERLAAGETLLGTWVSSGSPAVAEALAALGFDWLVVDMEHTGASVADAEHMFLAAERHGCAPLVRMPSADPILARRLLDVGAHGLLVPVVQSAETFHAFAAHCLYPPDGRRGVALGRFNEWGEKFRSYYTEFRPLLLPQIETKAGIAAADAIAALAEVDGLFFGPYDLSADLGTPGDFTTRAFTDALATVKAACTRHRKAAGGHQVAPDMNALRGLLQDGFRFVAYGTDLIVLRHALAGVRELVKR